MVLQMLRVGEDVCGVRVCTYAPKIVLPYIRRAGMPKRLRGRMDGVMAGQKCASG